MSLNSKRVRTYTDTDGVQHSAQQVHNYRIKVLKSSGLHGERWREYIDREFYLCASHFKSSDLRPDPKRPGHLKPVWNALPPCPTERRRIADLEDSCPVRKRFREVCIAPVLGGVRVARDDFARPASKRRRMSNPVPVHDSVRTLPISDDFLDAVYAMDSALVAARKENEELKRQLAAKIDELHEREEYLKKIESGRKITMRYEDVVRTCVPKDLDRRIKSFTGFVSKGAFEAFHELVLAYGNGKPPQLYQDRWLKEQRLREEAGGHEAQVQRRKASNKPSCLDSLNQLFMSLFVYRSGLPVDIVAFFFGIAPTTASSYWVTWTRALHQVLTEEFPFPSRAAVDATMPEFWRKHHADLRLVLDCTEMEIQVPSNRRHQSVTFSQYKDRNTMKVLVGISPGGACVFVSDAYGGKISDEDITELSKVGELCDEGDSISADKGFRIQAYLAEYGVYLTMPPMKRRNAPHISARGTDRTRDVANKRIHVERHMGRLKNYRFFSSGKLKINHADLLGQGFFVCSMLCNYDVPLTDKGYNLKLQKIYAAQQAEVAQD